MAVDKRKLFEELLTNYKKSHKKSEALYRAASRHQIRGCSHNLRYFAPFPFYDRECSGSKVIDIDGNTYVDFWQGHFANILGHNPKIVLDALIDYFKKGLGLATGFSGLCQNELAELILKQVPADKIRFTTSGTLATMYAIMLARSFTQRDLVLKVGGGWHGAQPYTLKGITAYFKGLDHIESCGLPKGIESEVIVTKFNDNQDLEEKFQRFGERLACFILEPFIGAGGFIFGKKGYIQKARELTLQTGSVLIFDEVVSGFRFHAGGIQTLYGVKPDLTVFGKAIGGGMPVSAVSGRGDIMELCDIDANLERKVKFEGGTFSSHPASMLAGLTFLRYLISHEQDIYSRIGKLGAIARKKIEEIFSSYGFLTKCTGGDSDVVENSSVVGVHFLKKKLKQVTSPEEVWNPEISDIELREKIFKLAMLEEGFNLFHGYGTISAAHSEEEIMASLEAVDRIAKKWKSSGLSKPFERSPL